MYCVILILDFCLYSSKGPLTISYLICPNFESMLLELRITDNGICVLHLKADIQCTLQSKYILGKYCILIPLPWGLGGGYFCDQFIFAESQGFARHSSKIWKYTVCTIKLEPKHCFCIKFRSNVFHSFS